MEANNTKKKFLYFDNFSTLSNNFLNSWT